MKIIKLSLYLHLKFMLQISVLLQLVADYVKTFIFHKWRSISSFFL